MVCGLMLLINCSISPLNQNDLKIAQVVQQQNSCKKLMPKAPCLAKLYKLGERNFHAVCAEEAPVKNNNIEQVEGDAAKGYCAQINRRG